MKSYKYFFGFLFFLFTFGTQGYVINKDIIKKYDDIFQKRILTSEDSNTYQKIFELQEICEWKKADKYILKIKDKILFGHVLAQRYLHPTCYK